MPSYDTLNEIKEQIIKELPANAEITEVEFEGPEIAIYSKNPRILIDDGEPVKALARKIRKRIVIRSAPEVRKDKEEVKKIILELVPPEAEPTNIVFDDSRGEVIIEAQKPGLVIGRGGTTLKEITKQTLWRPTVNRTPPLKSKLIDQIRAIINNESKTRRQILKRAGVRIHRQVLIKDSWVRVTALGGFREVGRTSILVQTPESKVLIDVGVNVGNPMSSFPHLDLPEASLDTIDAVIVTHAHLDHSGMVPYLFKYGYDGPVYTTAPTQNLMTLLQLDYLDIAEREGKLRPYREKDVKETILHTIPLEYGEVTDIAPDIRLTLHNAGHILGSAIVHLHIGDGKYNMAYTGDFKFERTRLLEPAVSQFPRLETLIMESTYGAPNDKMPPRAETEKRLARIISETYEKRGKVLIPVLAVGRAQELMIVLEDLMSKKKIPEIPIYIEGMIAQATAIHTAHPEYLSKKLRDQIFHQGYNPFLSEVFVQVESPDQRPEIVEGEPAIIMATSGMLSGGPSVEYFKMMAPDPRNTLIFVSYQVEGSLGRRIQRGWKEVQFIDKESRVQVINVKMQTHTLEGFSGHSDRKQLLNYIKKLQPKPEKILTCHGEASKAINLAATIHRTHNIDTRAPFNIETIRLR